MTPNSLSLHGRTRLRAGRLPVKQLCLPFLTCSLQRHHTRSPSSPYATAVWSHGGHECLLIYPKAELIAVLFLNRGEIIAAKIESSGCKLYSALFKIRTNSALQQSLAEVFNQTENGPGAGSSINQHKLKCRRQYSTSSKTEHRH